MDRELSEGARRKAQLRARRPSQRLRHRSVKAARQRWLMAIRHFGSIDDLRVASLTNAGSFVRASDIASVMAVTAPVTQVTTLPESRLCHGGYIACRGAQCASLRSRQILATTACASRLDMWPQQSER